jgi:glycerol-3-phosphate dehydrogenase
LHSGSRYAVKDTEAAVECIEENMILRNIVPEVIEQNGGMFIGLNDEDLAYGEEFIEANEKANIPIEEISPQKALELEPALNPKLLAAFLVPDATFDPLRLALSFAATAKYNGAKFKLFTEVTEMVLDGQGNVVGVKVWERNTDQRYDIPSDVVINATGAWAGEITQMAGAHVPIQPTPGVMVAYDKRLVERAINRLTKPSDGDIVLPQRRMVVVGTTSFSVEDLDYVPVFEDQVQKMMEKGSELIPSLQNTKERGAYMATRPLIGSGGPGRSISRTFKCFDHKETDSVDGFVTITGGKATTLRQMAEKTADVVCNKLEIEAKCITKETKLLSYRQFYMM